MLDTLIEVEGEERGVAVHSLDWLAQRVRWHLDRAETLARVVLGLADDGSIIGHAIYRIESRDDDPYGLIATTYVVPEFRKLGVASSFLNEAHRWFCEQGVNTSSTWTSGTNSRLIALYQKHGYEVVDHGPNGVNGTPMVKLGIRMSQHESHPSVDVSHGHAVRCGSY